MAIDIFNIQPSKISRDLKGKYILIYGAPKTGKSTFGSKLPRSLFLQFEQGTNALDGIKGAPIFKWSDMKSILRQLRDPRAKDIYDSIVVDTAGIAWTLCEQFVCQQNGVQQISEIPWGGGFKLVKQEFQETWREISLLGFGILFIAHEKERTTEMRDENGEQIRAVAPDLPSAPYSIINGLVDIIGYLSTQMNADGTTNRYLYTRATPNIFAGSRYKYIAPRISFNHDGYTELVNAIGDAIDKQVNMDGAQVTDKTILPTYEVRPFADTMAEARNLWSTIIEKHGDSGKESMKSAIHNVFGQDIQLSKATEEQQDLVELVIEEFKRIV